MKFPYIKHRIKKLSDIRNQKSDIRSGFTLIELLVARHPKSDMVGRRKAILGGFTLIELLVVISIIGILVTVMTISYYDAQKRGRDSRRIQDLQQIKNALQLYYNDNGHFPVSEWVFSNDGGSWIPGLSPNYIKSMPIDPINNGGRNICWGYSPSCYSYAYYSGVWCSYDGIHGLNSSGQYILYARLEGNSSSANSQKPYLYPDGNFCSNWLPNGMDGSYFYVTGQ